MLAGKPSIPVPGAGSRYSIAFTNHPSRVPSPYGVNYPWRFAAFGRWLPSMIDSLPSSTDKASEIARMSALADQLDEAALDMNDREAMALMKKSLRLRQKISELKGERVPTSDPSFLRNILRTVVNTVQPQRA